MSHEPARKTTVAGGVVVFQDEALILHKPKEEEFRLPKGKREPGESILQTAVREMEEESGYSGFDYVAPLGTKSVVFTRKGKLVERKESYVLLRLAKRKRTGPGEEKFEPMWLPFEEAVERLSFEAEKQWIRLAIDYLDRHC